MAIYSISKTEQEDKIYRKNWTSIFGKHQGSIYLLPTETEQIIIQIAPYLRISAILGSKTRNLRFSYSKTEATALTTEIKTPRILISHLLTHQGSRCGTYAPCQCKTCHPGQHAIICACPQCKTDLVRRKFIRDQFTIHSLAEFSTNTNLLTKPLKFANVYPTDARICFGYQSPVTNLRHANNNYWGTTFNNDFKHVEFNSHTYCDNKTTHYLHGHFNLRAKHTLNSCRRQVVHTCACACKNKVRHAYSCEYYRYGCRCACTCPCCQGACNCICNCSCCRKSCSCSCNCTFNEEFVEHLQGIILNNSGFYDHTCDFIGSQRIIVNNRFEGIFFSYDPAILKKISNEYHYSDTLYTTMGDIKPYVIGMVRSIPDNEWEITFEDGQILLLEDNEVGIV